MGSITTLPFCAMGRSASSSTRTTKAKFQPLPYAWVATLIRSDGGAWVEASVAAQEQTRTLATARHLRTISWVRLIEHPSIRTHGVFEGGSGNADHVEVDPTKSALRDC